MPKKVAKPASRDASAKYKYARQAGNTRLAYDKQWRAFADWCESEEADALPASPATVARYLSARADSGAKVATLAQAISAIKDTHVVHSHAPPTKDPEVKETWDGIRRKLGARPTQKAPLCADWLREMLEVLPDGLIGVRDRAILTIGFAGGFRRSELVALEADDVQFHPKGVELLLRRSKTDQSGRGHIKAIAHGENPLTCPVRSLEDWMELAVIHTGPIFRRVDRYENVAERGLTPQTVALIVKRTAKAAGLDPRQFSGHSLRAGFVTAATMGGAGEAAIMDQTGHRSVEMVHRYTRRVDVWNQPASSKLGL